MGLVRFLFALLLIAPASLSSQTTSTPVSLGINTGRNFRFVIFGDLRTAPVSETSSTDPVRRKAIIEAIAKDKPAFIVIGGDIVLKGSNYEDWQQWDRETAIWTQGKIPVVPALGNHDLNGDQERALSNYFQRFPELGRSRYYAARAGNVLVLTLDSSLPELAGPQGEWLKAQFANLSPEIDFVFVSLHHPPITHSHPSLRGGHSARPEEVALAQWLEEKQRSMRARIVVAAGHVHSYERYEQGGVVYIVSGGGGATPYSIPRTPTDAYREPGPAYHYCTVEVKANQLTLEMHKLDAVNGATASWRVADRLELKAAPRSEVKAPPKASKAKSAGGK